MELGEKLRQAREDAGLSQRQLCGETITRNMLSQIEHGTASPSMKTLRYLAERLGKPVSFFLEDTALISPNLEIMASARRLYDAGEAAQAALVLEGYQTPDPVFDREKGLLLALCRLDMAENAIKENKEPYALTLLQKPEEKPAYCHEAVERRRLLLLGRIRGQKVSPSLPCLDEELLLRAEEALGEQNPVRAAKLLDAAEDQESPRFFLLRGQAHLGQKAYQDAANDLHRAEGTYPQVYPMLEVCYRELGDYKRAYEYACKQRK